MSKIIKPGDDLIERVAATLAATWFEAGLNTPNMDMVRKKYRNDPRRFARMNIEKFVPVAIDFLMTMLQPTSNCTAEMREEIYDCLVSRVNDKGTLMPTDVIGLPDIDVKKLMEASLTPAEKDQDILSQILRPTNTQAKNLKNLEPPPKAQRH